MFTILSGLSVNVQTINLRGTISNGEGDPISGAIVTLLGQSLKDTTGSDGAYAFMQPTAIRPPNSAATGQVALTGNMLEFSLSKPSQVAIEVFDIKSNLLKSEKKDFQEAGVYRWDIAKEYPSNQLLIIRASVGGEISTFRFMPLTGRFSENTAVRSTSPVLLQRRVLP